MLLPSWKLTVPVTAEESVTVAVNVSEVPRLMSDALAVRDVVVAVALGVDTT